VCGAVGNCDWGVFALHPARFLGIVNGQYIYVHRRAGRWPDVITYGHFTAAEGDVGTYRFKKGRYEQLGNAYHTDVRGEIFGNKIPAFLDRARAACAEVGYKWRGKGSLTTACTRRPISRSFIYIAQGRG
jgi:hypothetical protein